MVYVFPSQGFWKVHGFEMALIIKSVIEWPICHVDLDFEKGYLIKSYLQTTNFEERFSSFKNMNMIDLE